MPRCAVPGCRSGYSSATSNEVPFVQRHFFKPPKDPNVLREWNNAAGRANFEVTQRSYICDRHFDEADICTSFQHVVNGETVSIPRGRWELKKGAVPRHFANCAELDLKLCVENVGTNAASVLVAEDDITPVLQSESETCTEMLEHENRAASNAESMEVIMKESSTGEHWFGGIEDLPVYGAWCVQHTDERVVFYKLQEIGGVVFIERAVVINKNSTVVVSAKGKLVPESSYTFINSDKLNFTTLKDAAPFLHLIESLGICNGFDSRLCPLISTSKTAERSGRTWRSKRCAVLSAKALCVQCRKAKKNLQCRQKRRSRKSKYVPLPSALLRNLRKKTIRATVLREKYKRDLLSLKKKLSSDPSNALLSEVLAELPPLQQLAFRTALQSMKAKSSRGVRYDCGWLLSCLLLKISSPRVYRLMSRMKILPLPTSTRLRQIIRGMPCEFGFNKLSLSSIGAFMKTMKGVQCYGTLVIDEMKLLSRSTAIGLDVYRRLKQDGLEDCEGTAAFTRIINDLFDALNIKLPRFGIRSTSKEIKARAIKCATFEEHSQ
ncbi:hypothetical protein HPB51_007343 [Rhipicephalus microplus]|uniref:THAP-type domain-containing protein n=1 Tax=Rhipicephalus microplus TaxID=6941 RepID=A0A9J6EYI7_RHIMP|nr:hypothetical protein HPB51_006056 [Rhipicephalus microplus]KAH8019320.1 hypothetical protein HPB51_018931 [Rhipicephalus microplus]KAH8025263.1 hypothetical protein HPB51_005614 [Rhipicephalus microplus]KAH8026000.1 hypothetical protein HPB51_015349 [Rhipicephalus microplus]KAH8031185.1 hypothetical protein HPB51_013642 [Rhipicephalus microplus]